MAVLAALLLFTGVTAFAQGGATISGKVVDKSGEGIPGAIVKVEGANTFVLTEADGAFSIVVGPNGQLSFSSMGYVPQVLPASGANMVVQLEDDAFLLEETVIVGYGSQKAKDLTAPITVVKGTELSKQATTNAAQALQGKIAGVQVINGGAPGAGATVRIRGVGSIGDYAKPLYVVDGVFVDNIDFLSSNDVESMSVLKDASASAIYGVRAANGVVIVTTKSGKRGDGGAVVTYEGYVGLQVPTNLMKMANTGQYVTLMNEANVNTIGYVPKDVSSYNGANTDWYDAILHSAMMTSHSLDVTGGSEKSTYSLGLNYLYQDGILNLSNDYNRYNIRARGDYQVSKYVKAGASFMASRYVHNKPGEDAFHQAYINPPTYNVYDDSNAAAYPVRFGSPQQVGLGNEYANPYAKGYYYDVREDGYHILPTVFLEAKLLDNRLTFKTQYNQDLVFFNTRDYQQEFFVGGAHGRSVSKLSKQSNTETKQLFDNTLTFADAAGKHSYSLLGGMSVRQEEKYWIKGLANNVPGGGDNEKYIKNGSSSGRDADDSGEKHRGMSYFMRSSYSYDGKYLATLTFRADGSSKFQEKWGYFPSVGLGWVVSDEGFAKDQQLFDFLKLRASWGMLGNDNVPANASQILGKSEAKTSGIFGDRVVDGVGAQTVMQNYVKWEVVNEFDVGVEFAFLKHRLTGSLDFYRRETDNVVFSAPVASGGGVSELLGNNGTVRNMGVEFFMEWRNQISADLSYSVSANLTYLNNQVTEVLNRPDGKVPGKEVNGATATYAVVGKPIGSFYGYKVEGVYQTRKELLDAPPGRELGDFILSEDIVYLGSPIPWLMGGIDFGLTYKGWDFSLALQGQLGNKVLNQKRMQRGTFPDANYDLDFYNNRWTKDNPSSDYPSAAALQKSAMLKPNSFFVEDASYIRISNVQLGYTIARSAASVLPECRVYLLAQRPLTLFGYNGFTPEVAGAPNESGIDTKTYPMQSVYSLGVNIKF